MKKVYDKVRKFCFEKHIKIVAIADALEISRQTIWGWKKRDIKYKDAVNLVSYTQGYIKMKDCGYNEA